ncbi:MAG: MaoC family dehydratase [Chloroflexota bacterium]
MTADKQVAPRQPQQERGGGDGFPVGAELPPITKHIAQPDLHRYADASGDHNPFHLDADFAASTQFGGTIAHGMLILAFASEMLTGAFGRDWLDSGRLKIRFRAPARPGDAITCAGRITKVEPQRVVAEIECRNQSGEVVLDGTAEIAAS